MTMETDVEQVSDLSKRKRSGWLVAGLVFLFAYVISIASSHTLGLALGWLPSAFLAAAFGWLGYCFPWLIDVAAFMIDLLFLLVTFLG